MTKILVIDDERPTLSMFRLFLSNYGFEVLTAETGEEGLEVFARERPPIVLTDIKMPGMDGIEVLGCIKEQDPLTEVIVITGHGDMDLAIKALNLDATDFINKPIQRSDLEAALKRARERIQLARSKSDEIGVRRIAPSGGMESGGDVAVVDIQGNVTSRSEAHLAEAFHTACAAPGGVVLAFNENASINGAGIALLTQLLLECQGQGRSVAITGLSENFRKVFDIVGVNKLAQVYDSEAEAVRALAG